MQGILLILSLQGILIIISLQGVADFEWQPVVASNISHLNLGNQMDMDQVTIININITNITNNINKIKMTTMMLQGLPNHRRVSFWQSMPVFWNSDRSNYKPAPPPTMAPHGGEL